MSPQDPTSQTPRPLDTEERALADRLARLGPHGEPSPALDSRILSAAHASVHQRAADSDVRRKPRVRWSVNLGIAASLVLAVGLAWQLRPLPDATVAYRSEADSALGGAAPEAKQESRPDEREMVPLPMMKPAPAADTISDSNGDAGDVEPRIASVAPPLEQPPAMVMQTPAPARELQPPPSPPAPPAPVFNAPAPAAKTLNPPNPTASTVSSAPIPAPASADTAGSNAPVAPRDARAFSTGTSAAETAAAAAQSSARLRKQADARDKASAAQSLGTVETAQPEAFRRQQARDAAAADMPDEDVPPATVASPIVRDAWLARIRELAADGRIDEARASLREFRVRYPGYLLPDDLRALEQQSGKPYSPGTQTPGSDTTGP